MVDGLPSWLGEASLRVRIRRYGEVSGPPLCICASVCMHVPVGYTIAVSPVSQLVSKWEKLSASDRPYASLTLWDSTGDSTAQARLLNSTSKYYLTAWHVVADTQRTNYLRRTKGADKNDLFEQKRIFYEKDPSENYYYSVLDQPVEGLMC